MSGDISFYNILDSSVYLVYSGYLYTVVVPPVARNCCSMSRCSQLDEAVGFKRPDLANNTHELTQMTIEESKYISLKAELVVTSLIRRNCK